MPSNISKLCEDRQAHPPRKSGHHGITDFFK